MTIAVQPTDFKPVIALLCTRGMEAFLSNAIKGILQAGIDADQIHVGCPDNALKSVNKVAALHSDRVRIISTEHLLVNDAEIEDYSSFGSRSFTAISWMKIYFLRQLIEIHPHVIYSDVDISWLGNPLPYLTEVAQVYPIAFQTEGLARFPPALCWGFASLKRSKRTIALLDALIDFHETQINRDERLDDQAACQRLIENDVAWLHDIFFLPEALFLNGLGYRTLKNIGDGPCQMVDELSPFLFHANWTIGIDNKHKLLASTGSWLLEETPQIHRARISGDASMDARGRQRHAKPPPPLLTVIYPVFDVRGNAIERIQLWTEQQDFAAHGYRVVVVAGTEVELDEAALRKVLRRQDSIVRVPGAARDADCWNAGARATITPWLLFVEAHALPKPDSLSALAHWIAANQDGAACNFRIASLDNHHVASLMKRWFGEIHAGWAERSTWPRLHRTAFAMRRDVFKAIGPFESQYGQFAPPLLSARMHQRGLAISLLPTSGVMHDDSPEMSAHHDDTADHVRGELDARANSDLTFFEKYFGPSPYRGPDRILPARLARSLAGALLMAVWRQPGEAVHLLRKAAALLPTSLVSLRDRANLLAALTRMDECAVMHLPLPEKLRWKRFLLAHGRVVRTEQTRWLLRNPLAPLQTGLGKLRWPIDTLGQQAIIGLHALEYSGEEAFRWTEPVFLLRLARGAANGVLTLETRNVGRQINSADIVIVVGGRLLSLRDMALDDAGNISLSIQLPEEPTGETNIVAIVRELSEPASEGQPGRRLGLPLFSVGFECDGSTSAPPTN